MARATALGTVIRQGYRIADSPASLTHDRTSPVLDSARTLMAAGFVFRSLRALIDPPSKGHNR
ncbi:hypothetical protein DMB37_10340 [Nocardia sp. CS682]|nr:hypothetical protein DMB37_10340 [Nocardia sp. CS682]